MNKAAKVALLLYNEDMIFSKRELIILNTLIKKDVVTSQQLAFIANVSVRTIKNEFKLLRERLNTQQERLVSTSGLGYSILPQFKSEINKLIEQQSNENFSISSTLLTDRNMRVLHMFGQIVMEHKKVKYSDLSEGMYISESLVKKDLDAFSDLLSKYNLEVSLNHKKEIIIEGTELNFRNIIFNYFDKNFLEKHTGLKLNEVSEVIKNLQQKHTELMFSSYSTEVIAKNTLIMKYREELGFHYQLEIKKEYPQILQLSKEYLKTLNLSETKYLDYVYLNFLTKRIYNTSSIIDQIENLRELIGTIAAEIKITFDIDIAADKQLYNMLSMHLGAMISRNRLGISSKNKVEYNYLRRYLFAVKITMSVVEIIDRFYNLELGLDEFMLLVYYFNTIIMNQQRTKQRKIGFLSLMGRSEDLMYYNILSDSFFLPKYKVIALRNVEEISKDVDIIVTNYKAIDDKKIDIPVIEVTDDLPEEIRYAFHLLDLKEIDLSQYFKKEYFVHNIEGNNKVEVSKSIFNIFKNLNVLYEKDENEYVFKDIELGNGSVMLQDTYNSFKKPIFFIGYLKNPILWNGQQVSVITLIKTKKEGDKDLSTLNSLLSKWLSDTKLLHLSSVETNYYRHLYRLLKIRDEADMKGLLNI